MMNEKRAATDLVRFDNFLHSAFFLLHCAFRMSLTPAAASLARIPKSVFAGQGRLEAYPTSGTGILPVSCHRETAGEFKNLRYAKSSRNATMFRDGTTGRLPLGLEIFQQFLEPAQKISQLLV
jgi:hypothetical protein